MNDKNISEIKNQFIERAGFLGTLFGFSRVLGQLYAVLFFSPDPLTLDDMSNELAMSKSNVCINIRELMKWGFVKKIWIKGERKDFYVPETDMKKVFNTRLRDAVQRRIDLLGEMLEDAGQLMPSKRNAKELGVTIERLAQIKKVQKKINGLIKGLNILDL